VGYDAGVTLVKIRGGMTDKGAFKQAERGERLFVVRLWNEPGAAPQFRGLIEDVQAQQRFYFSSLAELNEFLRLRVAHLS
jgi:hypothetical protein